jgi:hypothetical protein
VLDVEPGNKWSSSESRGDLDEENVLREEITCANESAATKRDDIACKEPEIPKAGEGKTAMNEQDDEIPFKEPNPDDPEEQFNRHDL